jgi:hypothetical protein
LGSWRSQFPAFLNTLYNAATITSMKYYAHHPFGYLLYARQQFLGRELTRNRERRTSQNSFKANFAESPKREVLRIPIPRNRVNKAERMSCWENTGREEGSVPIMGITQSVGKREVECE